MSDVRNRLAEKFKRKHRYSNFGQCINRMHIAGFRGVSTEVNFEYPVTALTGLNGAGKSTIGQIALCAYRTPSQPTAAKRFYVKDFFPVSIADPSPFVSNASVIYSYQTDKIESDQDLTISRQQKEWSGYKRQPERNTEYVGFTVYIPKVEKRDLSIYSAKTITLTERTDIENARKHLSRILGAPYDEIFFQGISAGKKTAQLGFATRHGYTYSENNMGFGEGRTVYIVRLLETCPERSLVVLEEPETSLHENAQYEFVKYLLDVTDRRKHQIIFSTHSSVMMDALPPEGRKLLTRTSNGVQVYDRISSSRIRTALSLGQSGRVVICVEDLFAQSMLREILKLYNPNILQSVEIIPFGDAKSVVSAKKVLEDSRVKAIAVRDGDQGSNEVEKIFSLPGSLPPEKEVFLSKAVIKFLMQDYNFDFKLMMAANPDLNHHYWSSEIVKDVRCSREVLEADAIRVFLKHNENDYWLPFAKKLENEL